MEQKGRILAIDYGLSKCGIAVTDTLQIACHPLDTMKTHLLVDFLDSYVQKEPVVAIVIGDPSAHTPGKHPLVIEIEKFNQYLRNKYSSIDIYMHDETLTSRQAKNIIIQSGVKKKKRRDKMLIDQISAILILQDFLGHHI